MSILTIFSGRNIFSKPSKGIKDKQRQWLNLNAMPTTIKLTLVPFPNTKTLSPVTFPITSPISRRACSSSKSRILIVKCNNSGQIEGSGGNLKDALAGMVDKQVGELLNREENRVLLDGLDKASQRVERAKKELAEIEKQELEAKQMREYINQLESQASEVCYLLVSLCFIVLIIGGHVFVSLC